MHVSLSYLMGRLRAHWVADYARALQPRQDGILKRFARGLGSIWNFRRLEQIMTINYFFSVFLPGMTNL